MSLRIEQTHHRQETTCLQKVNATRTPQGISSFETVLQNSTEVQPESKTMSALKNIPIILKEFYFSLLRTILRILEKLLAKGEDKSSPLVPSSDTSWELPSSPTEGAALTPSRLLPKDDAFSKLPIDDEKRKKIYFIVHTLAEAHRQSMPAAFALAKNMSKLQKAGDEIIDVHPLKFLEYIMLIPQLVKDLETLQDANSMLTWSPFVKGLTKNLDTELTAGRLPSCIDGFGRSLNIDPKAIQSYVDKKEWLPMVKFLIDSRLDPDKAPKPAPVTPSTPATSSTPPATSSSSAPPLPTTPATNPLPTQPNTFTATPKNTPPILPKTSELPFTSNQEKLLKDIITSVATEGYIKLGFDAARLKGEWRQLGEIHPLRILLYIYTTKELLKNIKVIFEDKIKWNGTMGFQAFAGDLSDQLALSKDTCEPYLDEFAAAIGVSKADFEKIIPNPASEKSVKATAWEEVIEIITKKK